MSYEQMAKSFHYEVERAERHARTMTITNGAYGIPVCKIHDKKTWKAITDLGVMIITNEEEDTIITCYLAREGQLKQLYREANEHLPARMVKRVQKNNEKYLKKYNERI